MGYVICEKCGGCYKLEADESINDFESCQCGGQLKYVETIAEPQIPKKNNRKTLKNGKTYTAQKSNQGIILMAMGTLITLIGLLLVNLTGGISFYVTILGIIIIGYAFSKSGSWIKGDIGERITTNHLKKLPEKDYVIFDDVKLPESHGNIDHIVVGKTGIFVIETKNYLGHYIVDGDEWFYKNDNGIQKSLSNPGKQAKKNSIHLKKYLSYNGVRTFDLWINSIVAMTQYNITIQRKPKNYEILRSSDIPRFIINRKEKLDPKTLKKTLNLLDELATNIH